MEFAGNKGIFVNKVQVQVQVQSNCPIWNLNPEEKVKNTIWKTG